MITSIPLQVNLFSLCTIKLGLVILNSISNVEIPNDVLYWTAGSYSDRWEWASNAPFEPFSYDNWAEGEPNGNQTLDKYCIYASFNPFSTNFTTGYWYDDKCSVDGFKFICELND